MAKRILLVVLFVAIVCGVLGGIAQLLMFGTLVESGSIGPAGALTAPPSAPVRAVALAAQ
jgi:hypothetical protein